MPNNRDFLLTCSLRELDSEGNINTIRNAIYDGAQAFMIHLEKLEEMYHNESDLKKIFSYAGEMPVISVNYRTPRRPSKTDEQLVEGQLIAAKAGAQVVDIVADIYDPSKDEISYDENAINKQKALIEKFHELGCKVMLSSHTFRYLTQEETIKHCKELEKRGADWVKIAVTANSQDELNEVNLTTIELKKVMNVPFFHCCMGQYGKLHRVYSGLLGSKIVLCVQNYNENSNPKEQPLLRSTKTVFDNLDFTMTRDDTFGTVRNI